MSSYDYAVFIGRCQPPHREHIDQIKRGLGLAEKVIVVLGSARSSPRPKNPFTAKERTTMLKLCFTKDELSRIHFASVRDYFYNENAWFSDLFNTVNQIVYGDDEDENKKICLLGMNKDRSSYYLDLLASRWKPEFFGLPKKSVSATDIRVALFEDKPLPDYTPDPIKVYLKGFRATDKFMQLKDYYNHIKKYKQDFSFAGEKARGFEPVFVTTDAVVISGVHVLVIRRKMNPGKGCLALPGGHLKSGVSVQSSMLAELWEETRIRLRGGVDELENSIVDSKVFDHPDRSERGRTISHGFLISLKNRGELPRVKGGDDASKAFWLPIADIWIYEDEFFEDHAHIIEYFTRKL